MQLEKGAAGAGPGQEFILSFVDLNSGKRKKRTDRMGFIGFMCGRHVVEESTTLSPVALRLCVWAGLKSKTFLPPSLSQPFPAIQPSLTEPHPQNGEGGSLGKSREQEAKRPLFCPASFEATCLGGISWTDELAD